MEPPVCKCGLIAVGKCTQCSIWFCSVHQSNLLSTNTICCMGCSDGYTQQLVKKFQEDLLNDPFKAIYVYSQLRVNPYLMQACEGISIDGFGAAWPAFALKHHVSTDRRGLWEVGRTTISPPINVERDSDTVPNCYLPFLIDRSGRQLHQLFDKRGRTLRDYSVVPNSKIHWRSVISKAMYLTSIAR